MKNTELKNIITFAIDNEIEAYEFYDNASKKVTDKALKETFEELAAEELGHRKFLENFLVNDVEAIKLDEVNDYKVSETIDKPALTTEMKFSEAMAFAMKDEEEAMNMYQKLADACLDEKQKELFVGLAKMEQSHKVRLEKIYVNVAYPEVW